MFPAENCQQSPCSLLSIAYVHELSTIRTAYDVSIDCRDCQKVNINLFCAISSSKMSPGKLFSNYSNLCDHGTCMNVTYRCGRTDGQIRTTYCRITALFVASRGKNENIIEQESRVIAGKTAWCRCKFRYSVSNSITASCGFPAAARLSYWLLSADYSESPVKKWQV